MGRQRLVLAVCADAQRTARVLEGIRQPGLEVLTARTSQDALSLAEERGPDMMVIDALLPDVSGLGLCRLLREHPRLASTPVLMLSPYGAEIDRVLAFEAEVDDYLPSDFSARELASRARAILRRAPGAAAAGRSAAAREPLDPIAGLGDDVPRGVRFTARETEVLASLVDSKGAVLRREKILSQMRGSEALSPRVVDAHVKNIRRKLGPAGRRLETVRGLGYRLRERSGRGDAP